MSLVTMINYLASFLWIKREVKFVKVSMLEVKRVIQPFNRNFTSCQCWNALYVLGPYVPFCGGIARGRFILYDCANIGILDFGGYQWSG